jgi:hypothetical protein
MKNKKSWAPKKFGRPEMTLSESDAHLVLETYKEQNSGARRLEKIIEHKYGRRIPHNAIHRVLLENGLSNENNKKKKRRKPWIRYERKHSLTAVHLDWHTSRFNGREVCVVLDDSSRFILSGGEFSAATAEASIDLVREALEEFGEIRWIREVITDHGSQFSANKTDKNGDSESAFSQFLQENKISISWPESSIPKLMAKSKNGTILTRKPESYLMILTNSRTGTTQYATMRGLMKSIICKLQKMHFDRNSRTAAS